jgi:hypothetical protein
MRTVWRKPDYPYMPHLTLYDGLDHDLGDELYYRLRELRPIFKFYVSKMHVVESKAQRDFDLISKLDLGFSPGLANLKGSDFRNLDSENRIRVAVEAVKAAVEYSARRG